MIELTTYERGLIINALREAARHPMSMASLNEDRKVLIERLHVEGVKA